jgi:outer membrane receptor protein involved in Fe transport
MRPIIRPSNGLLVRAVTLVCLSASVVSAQSFRVSGIVRDETGGILPGATVELRAQTGPPAVAVTDGRGDYLFDGVASGRYQLSVALLNFATARRDVTVSAGDGPRVDVTLHLALTADVTVTGMRTFANLADLEDPAANLVGVAQSASQGAITSRQLAQRPLMRSGEVLETVPGVIISQHSGEGKANQYYLRGFNLDHGTDFASTVAGMPVNMPTHGHGHGYSDLNFLIPELVSGVQYSKGPYFADQGDFATAGSANIQYANRLDRPLVRFGGGDEGFRRALLAASPRVGAGNVLAAVEIEGNDGPWTVPDNYRKLNGVVRYSQGDAVNGFSVTAMAYRGTWRSTDQIPQRAVDQGIIGRFGTLDPSDGGDTYRYSGSIDWQRAGRNSSTRVRAYGIGSDLNLFSNFTFFLDDAERGDQFHQADHRFVSGANVSHRRLNRWAGRALQTTFGAQLRNDAIGTVGLYHTEARRRFKTVRQDSVLQTSGGIYVQNEIAWTPWLRTLAGVRGDEYRFRVDAGESGNGGRTYAGRVSPKGGVVFGPFRGTELYANAGYGFHSNDARGATITRDPSTGEAAERVTPLVAARGAEVGIRTVAIPHLQSSVSWWTLGLDSELVFVGDAGTTEPGRPSRRHGVELATYYRPRPWIVIDGDLSISRGRFTDTGSIGDRIPGSVATVVSAGISLNSLRNVFATARLRYFGSRPLIEDDSVRSNATSLINLQAGYQLAGNVRVAVDVFNLLNARDSDIDYYYASRLPGEPAGGVNDIHFHPALPRTVRIGLVVGF